MGCCKGRPTEYDEEDQPEPIFKKVRERGCTDILCCLLLFLMIITMVSIAVFSLINGDINYIIYPHDYLSQFCGYSSGVEHLPKGYFPQLDKDIKEFLPLLLSSPYAIASFRPYTLCVESCPNIFSLSSPQAFGGRTYPGAARSNVSAPVFYNLRATETAHHYCLPTTRMEEGPTRLICGMPTCLNETLLDQLDPLGIPHPNCTTGANRILSDPSVDTAWVITDETKPFCEFVVQENTNQQFLPDGGDDPQTRHFERLFAQHVQWAYAYFEAVLDARQQVFIAGLGFPLIFAFCWFIFLFLFAGFIIMLAILLFFCCMLAGCIWLYAEAGLFTLDALEGCAKNPTNCTISTLRASGDEETSTWYLVFAVAATICLVMYMMCIYLWRDKISRTIAIVRECTKVFKAVPLLMFYPLVEIFFYLCEVVYFVSIGGYIITQGSTVWAELSDEIQNRIGSNSSLVDSRGAFVAEGTDSLLNRLNNLSTETQVAILLTIHVVGFVWGLFLIHACYYTTVAGVVARWFFGNKKDERPKSFGCGIGVIWISAWCVITRHLGSMAFGSLIMTFVWFVRTSLAWLDYRTKDLQDTNCLLKIAVKCARCVVWCLYKSIEMLTEFGYVFIAIEGCNLCSACRSVFALLERQGAQVATNKMVGGILSLIISFSIPSICALICFGWVRYELPDVNALWPALTVFASAFLVASGVTEVFRCTIDTVFVAAFKDLDSHGDPLYMSDDLRRGFDLPATSQNEGEGIKMMRPSYTEGIVGRGGGDHRDTRGPSMALPRTSVSGNV